MNGEDRRNIWITGILCATLIILVLGFFSLHNQRTKMFVENGYTQQTMVGKENSEWVKIEQ